MKNGIKTSINLEQLDKALQGVEDLFDRAHRCPILLLGQTARSIIDDGQVTGNKLEIGVKQNQLTPEVRSVLRELVKDLQELPDHLEFTMNEVPIFVRIIKRDYSFLKMPDSLVYKWADYCIPNPFEVYWQVRGFIR